MALFYILINAVYSVFIYFITVSTIPKFSDVFLKAKIFGIDANKRSSRQVPEALGVITGCVFLIFMFLFIPVPFSDTIMKNEVFPHNEFVEMIAALLSICCMLLLGFADDVLDLRWRHKLILPTIASLPILMVYYVNFNSTTVIVPRLLRTWLGYSINLGLLYYVYMGMLAVFCTNAINILAGINGLEVGQSVVIACSIALFNLIELTGEQHKAHRFSIQFIMPYTAASLALLKHNWFILMLLWYWVQILSWRSSVKDMASSCVTVMVVNSVLVLLLYICALGLALHINLLTTLYVLFIFLDVGVSIIDVRSIKSKDI